MFNILLFLLKDSLVHSRGTITVTIDYNFYKPVMRISMPNYFMSVQWPDL